MQSCNAAHRRVVSGAPASGCHVHSASTRRCKSLGRRARRVVSPDPRRVDLTIVGGERSCYRENSRCDSAVRFSQRRRLLLPLAHSERVTRRTFATVCATCSPSFGRVHATWYATCTRRRARLAARLTPPRAPLPEVELATSIRETTKKNTTNSTTGVTTSAVTLARPLRCERQRRLVRHWEGTGSPCPRCATEPTQGPRRRRLT